MGEDFVCGYKLLRELGARALPSYAAIDPKPRRPEDALCVVERLAREPGVGAESAAEFLRDAKRLTQLRHPNLVQVRDVVLGTSTVLLVTDWVEGEVLSDIQRMAAEQGVPIPLAGGLRVVVDLLEGLSALHEVCDAKREPLRIVHAEVAPRNIVVGVDGRSVLVHPLRAPTGPARRHAPDVIGYLAPEVLLGDQTADQRADVYGAGVLLWEALTGQRMHADGEDMGEIVMRLLGGKIEPPCAPVDAPWAAPLAEAAKKAVSPDPSVRFANATAMLADVRRVVGARLAPKLTVSALVEAVAGERIRARRSAFGVARTVTRLPSESAWTTEAPAASPPPTPATPPAAPSGLDPDATKPPPPSLASSTASASGAERAAPSVDSPSRPRASEPPTSADVVEVIEMEVPPDKPSRPHAPPPVPRREKASAPPRPPLTSPPPSPQPPSPLRFETPMTSKTDMGAALVSAPSPAGGGKARWTIVAACAIGAGAVLWMLLRASGEGRRTNGEPPVASVAASAAEATPAPAPSPPPHAAPVETAASAPPSAGSDRGPFDPVADDHPARRATPPSSPPIPTVTAPAPAPAPPPAPAPAAASSTHPKKRVYDPMGI